MDNYANLDKIDQLWRLRRLWAAIIVQQMQDVVRPGIVKVNSKTALHRQKEIEKDREIARRWLMIPNEDFHAVCDMIGLDPEFMRKKIKPLLDNKVMINKPSEISRINQKEGFYCDLE